MVEFRLMKRKTFLGPIILIPVLVISVILFAPKPKLISPLIEYLPDLSAKLSAKVVPPLDLDFSSAKELPTLIGVPHYLVFNLETGRVYAAKADKDKIAPGSFTKLLMGQVALDLGFKDQLITATKSSVDKVPTVLELVPGEQLTLSELLRGAIATSANDAAATIAEGIASQNGLTLADFIKLMNQKAKLLQMNASYFATPDGLDDPNQFSSLTDLSRLVVNTVKYYPDIMAAAISDREDIGFSPTHGTHYLPNWNGLLGTYPGVFGLKIAYTESAGHGTIVLAERNGVRLAALVAGVDSDLARDMAAAALLDAGFIGEKVAPVNLSRYTIKRRYQQWADLAKFIRHVN